MSTRFVQMKAKAEHATELATAFKTVVAALAEEKPRGVGYTVYQFGDGATFTVLLELEDGVENPLPAIPAFRDLQEGLKTWLAEPVAAEQVALVGDHRS